MEGYIDFDSYHLYTKHVQCRPDAPTLVFLHDAWGCIDMWGDFPQRLADSLPANYLVYDRAGHGKSGRVDYERRPTTFFEDEAAVLIKLMDKLGIGKAILYGHSDGGTIALTAAALYPERISGLILQSAHTCTEPEGLKLVADITEASKHTHLCQSLARFHGENMPNVFNYWSRMWADKRFQKWDIVRHIQKVTCPIIAFRGENDRFDTVKQNTTIAEHTGGKIIMTLIPNAAHNSHKENPEATLQFILANKTLLLDNERK